MKLQRPNDPTPAICVVMPIVFVISVSVVSLSMCRYPGTVTTGQAGIRHFVVVTLRSARAAYQASHKQEASDPEQKTIKTSCPYPS